MTTSYRLPNGEVIDLFYIGELAEALGRTPRCIRQWEIAGHIPPPCFRDCRGARLYSQRHIDAVASLAEKHRICTGRPICQTNFSRDVAEAFYNISEFYLGKEEDKCQGPN